MTETFIDLHAVASMRGVYLSSQLAGGKVGQTAISTVITYDKGNFWFSVTPPVKSANGSMIKCSLQVSLQMVEVCRRTCIPAAGSLEVAIFHNCSRLYVSDTRIY